MSIVQRERERQFDSNLQVLMNSIRHGVIPNLQKTLTEFAKLQAALSDEYSDMTERYVESVSLMADDIPGIITKAKSLLSSFTDLDERIANDKDAGQVYPNGYFGTYTPPVDEGENE